MIDLAKVDNTLAALRSACDEVGIPYVKTDRKADLREKIAEFNAKQVAPGLPGGEPHVESDQANGFLLVKRPDGNGNVSVDVVPIGDATMLEAPAVVGAALRQVKEYFGL